MILSWCYIGFLCYGTGRAVNLLLRRILRYRVRSLTATLLAGIVGITVYAEIASIFYKVGMAAHLPVLLLSVFFAGWQWAHTRRKDRGTKEMWRYKPGRAEIVLLCMVALIIAFYTSRGTFHYDTGIYHAQAIRLIEEYGVIKGLGNLQLHFAYNSAYLLFCAFFTMRWTGIGALHTTTGFLALLASGYAIHILAGQDAMTQASGGRKPRVSMACAAATMLYLLTNVTGSMSPATDYATMYLTLLFLCMLAKLCEDAGGDEQHDLRLGLLSVFALFLVSVKMSAAGCVLLVILPLYRFVRTKQYGLIFRFLCVGAIIILPYLIRNVILSGWLFYPVGAFDFFDVPWKVPDAYRKVDADQIIVWGRCLYDITKIDLPVWEWLRPWWSTQRTYERALIGAEACGVVLLCMFLGRRVIMAGNHRKAQRDDAGRKDAYGEAAETGILILLHVICGAMWFLSSPFIRYGLAYLLSFPLLMMALALWEGKGFLRPAAKKAWSVLTGIMAAGICVCLVPWVVRYTRDDLRFVAQHITEPYYVMQQPFDNPPMEAVAAGTQTVYLAVEEDRSSYYVYPATAYPMMWERSALLGETIEEGFCAR